MSQFADVLRDAADADNCKLGTVLLKAKIVASRVHGRKFRRWVDSELNGYGPDSEISAYRTVTPLILGDFAGSFGSRKTMVPLALDGLPERYKRELEVSAMKESVAALESMLGPKDGLLGIVWPPAFLELMRQYGGRIQGMILNQVTWHVTDEMIVGVLSSIRFKLLDLLLELRESYPELETNDDAVGQSAANAIDAMTERFIYQNCTIMGGPVMGDQYSAGQAGAMGPGAKAKNMTFEQVWVQNRDAIDLTELADELGKLRSAMKKEETTAEQDASIGDVAKAEEAAKKGLGSTCLEYLGKAGKWSWEIANKIGVSVAAKAIEKAMGA